MSIDSLARALAVRAAMPALVRPQRVATRIFGGRIYNVRPVTTDVVTYETLIALAAPAEAIRVLFAFGQTVAGDAVTPRATVTAASVASIGQIQAGETVLVPVPDCVPSGGTIPQFAPAGAAGRRVFYRSAWVSLPSMPRGDGHGGALYAVRTSLSLADGGGNVVLLGNGTDRFDNWDAHPSGRLFRMRSKIGVSATNWAGMTDANSIAATGSPVVGLEYLARGKVVSVMGFGDSIAEGRGTYLNEGFGLPACVAASRNPGGIAFEWSNLGWSGHAMAQTTEQVQAAIAFGLRPSLAVVPLGSPNNASGGAITPAQVGAMRLQVAEATAALERAGVPVLPFTWAPTDPRIRAYGASDALRRAYGADAAAMARGGGMVCDFAEALSGPPDAQGQSVPPANLMPDGIHPGDAGNAILANLLRAALDRMADCRPGYRAA
ncbi:SGNH/GDSL hydrolase family protein [Sphingomonas sp. Leaf4]|uniref:SGNH/GDSL hydrolase family protein n=1 Tax=Sphingomonas sp. Leaf4 TaxID=2876553 RepID=UPI001E40DCAE|nr:SGNH/GDSL hydrolase family protein [Sphingomonas sp. Leaf4]